MVAALMCMSCFVFQYAGTRAELIRRSGPGPTSVAIYEGRLSLTWDPRTAYRPKWAGQTNDYGIRYNVYSNGTRNVSGPLWKVGILLAAAGVPLAALPWLRFSYSLRTLLIAITGVAAGLGALVWSIR